MRDQNKQASPSQKPEAMLSALVHVHSVLGMEASQHHSLSLSIRNQRKKEKGVTEALRLAEDLIFPQAG